MTGEDVLLTISPCEALPATGPGRASPERITLASLVFRDASDPSVPRGHTLAEGAFRFGERCLKIEVAFGGPPHSSLVSRVDDVLASLSIEP